MLFLLFLFLFLFSLFLLLINFIFSNKMISNRNKNSPFECGFSPISPSRLPFSSHFFLISLIFLIFDIEISMLIPLIFLFYYFNKFLILTFNFNFFYLFFLLAYILSILMIH